MTYTFDGICNVAYTGIEHFNTGAGRYRYIQSAKAQVYA